MVSNALSVKSFDTKTPAVCRKPPLPPPIPPPPINKAQMFCYVDWSVIIEGTKHVFYEYFRLNWATLNNWQAYTSKYPQKPWVLVKFGGPYLPARFRVLAWYWVPGMPSAFYYDWIDEVPELLDPFFTGHLYFRAPDGVQMISLYVKQKPP